MPETIADGLRTVQPGAITFPIVKSLVDDVLLVTEDEMKQTVRFLLTRLKILAEPSGAAGAAAVLHQKLPRGLKRVGVIISGGNIDLKVLAGIAGRRLKATISWRSWPLMLARNQHSRSAGSACSLSKLDLAVKFPVLARHCVR